jgi:hypothetical protein
MPPPDHGAGRPFKPHTLRWSPAWILTAACDPTISSSPPTPPCCPCFNPSAAANLDTAPAAFDAAAVFALAKAGPRRRRTRVRHLLLRDSPPSIWPTWRIISSTVLPMPPGLRMTEMDAPALLMHPPHLPSLASFLILPNSALSSSTLTGSPLISAVVVEISSAISPMRQPSSRISGGHHGCALDPEYSSDTILQLEFEAGKKHSPSLLPAGSGAGSSTVCVLVLIAPSIYGGGSIHIPI